MGMPITASAHVKQAMSEAADYNTPECRSESEEGHARSRGEECDNRRLAIDGRLDGVCDAVAYRADQGEARQYRNESARQSRKKLHDRACKEAADEKKCAAR